MKLLRNSGVKIVSFCKNKPTMAFSLCYIIAALLFVPKFANGDNLLNIVIQSSDLIILSIGMTFVFLNGGIDFSVTAVLALTSVVGAKILTSGLSPELAIPLALLVMFTIGLGIGVINGFSVTVLKMPSFIATMATQLVFSGVALTITQSSTIGNLPKEFNNIAQGSILGIPLPIITTSVIVIIATYLLHRTTYGRYVFSVGTNHKTSYISGIPVKKTIFELLIISSILATIAGIIMTARLGAGIPSLGKDSLMDIVTAVIIGGTSITGGEGNIIGTAVGAVLVLVLNNSLNLLHVDWYIINVCKGSLILIMALLDVVRHRAK